MNQQMPIVHIALCLLAAFVASAVAAEEITFKVVLDRGADLGQNFGSLFEATTKDGSLVIGAGFQNLYNTRNRADRHALQFFIRPVDGQREFVVQPLPRPNNLCGTYLYGRDEIVYSTYGGLKAWDAQTNDWRGLADIGGTQEKMRVGKGLLEFGDSTVKYDGRAIAERAGWPPVLPGVSASAREAQTTVIYGGELFVGVWPWGELWRYQPDARKWSFARRMFDHPQLSDQVVHPYDVENRDNAVSNQWGQRVTSLVTRGSDLLVATSAKDPCEWDAGKFPFLAPEKWKSYGTVYRLTMPGHLGASTAWTAGPTTFDLTLRGKSMSISQDGKKIAETVVNGPLAERMQSVLQVKPVRWGEGIYGGFTGPKLDGTVKSEVQP